MKKYECELVSDEQLIEAVQHVQPLGPRTSFVQGSHVPVTIKIEPLDPERDWSALLVRNRP